MENLVMSLRELVWRDEREIFSILYEVNCKLKCVRQKWCTDSLQIIIDRYGDDEFLELVEEVCSLEGSQWEGWYIKRSAAIISERGDCFRDWMVQWKKRKIRFLSVDEESKEFRGTLLGMFVEERKATDVYGQVMIR
jgi:hypothetical protein